MFNHNVVYVVCIPFYSSLQCYEFMDVHLPAFERPSGKARYFNPVDVAFLGQAHARVLLLRDNKRHEYGCYYNIMFVLKLYRVFELKHFNRE